MEKTDDGKNDTTLPQRKNVAVRYGDEDVLNLCDRVTK